MANLQVLLLFALSTALFLRTCEANTEKPIGQPLLCYGCLAVLQEVHKSLWSSSGTRRAMDSKFQVSSLCKTDNFVVYKFSPPKMTKACEQILADHRSSLQPVLSTFYKKFKSQDLPRKVMEEACVHKTPCCPAGLPPLGEEKFNPEGMNINEANEKIKKLTIGQEEPLHITKDEL